MAHDQPAHHGDPTGEYLALRRASGLVTGRHDVVWVRGGDAKRFLEGLLSQRIDGMQPGVVTRSLLLAPNGKLRAMLHVLHGDDEIGLVGDSGTAEIIIADLSRFKIRVAAELVREERPILELWGPGSAGVLERAELAAPQGWLAEPLIASLPFPHGGSFRYLVAGVEQERLFAAGAVRAGQDAADTVRIEMGEPVVGVDVDEKTIPQETGLVADAVDFDKGCYLGQELVARIDSRGRVNRHLRGLQITENVLPPRGSEIVWEDRVVGEVTSLGESLDLRAPVGLGLVRREVEPDDEVELRWQGGSTRARVRALPMVE